MNQTLTYREAWRDFHAHISMPENWSRLTQAERNRVSLAESDYHERRTIKRTGKPYALGEERIEAILNALAPGRYVFEKRVILLDQ